MLVFSIFQSKNPGNPLESQINYLVFDFFVIIHSGNRAITTPNDTPSAIINQNPALLGLHSMVE